MKNKIKVVRCDTVEYLTAHQDEVLSLYAAVEPAPASFPTAQERDDYVIRAAK